jgi:DnaJ-class molecular chaperone
MIVEFRVETPSRLTKRQEELLREFAEIEREKGNKRSWTQRVSESFKEALG